MAINLNKRYQTREGFAVTLNEIDETRTDPIRGIIHLPRSADENAAWTMQGYFRRDGVSSVHDLVEVKEKEEKDVLIDINKAYQTEAGHEVVLYDVDKYNYPAVHGKFKTRQGRWLQGGWHPDGIPHTPSMRLSDTVEGLRLVEKPETLRSWVVMAHDKNSGRTFLRTAGSCLGTGDPDLPGTCDVLAKRWIELEKGEGIEQQGVKK